MGPDRKGLVGCGENFGFFSERGRSHERVVSRERVGSDLGFNRILLTAECRTESRGQG